MLHPSRQPDSEYTDSLISPPSPGNQVLVSNATPGTTLRAFSADRGDGRQQGFDTTGQIQPSGKKPRVTATLWEDENSLCFQVEVEGVCVARREGKLWAQEGGLLRTLAYGLLDNHMINGTKLLNVAGMNRGRRDGILKSEKTRHVVKIGPMHLKGVW
jgi:protein SOK2